MNKFIFMYFLCILMPIIQSCSSDKEVNDSYIINGELKGLSEGKAILAKLDLHTNEPVNVDSTDIVKGKFTFKGKVESPYLHTIFINGNSTKIYLFLENSRINISAAIDHIDDAQVAGSREDSLFRSFETESIFDRKKGMDIMLKHPDYAFAVFTAYYQFQIHNIRADTLSLIVNSFKGAAKESTYFKHLDTLYHNLKKVAISQPAPDFNIPDANGKMVALADFRGTYVLIDFWASWCAPCRAANPLLVQTYNKLKERNFTIIGISVDKHKERWLNAIEKDELPWTNLSLLKGWDEVSGKYGVKAVPQNFLIDPKGIIIDKNIEPEHLIEKLDQLLPEI